MPAHTTDADARPRRWVLVGYVVAAAVGAKYGYDFGVQIGGMPMGVLVGANCAVFAWLMVGAAATAVLRLTRR